MTCELCSLALLALTSLLNIRISGRAIMVRYQKRKGIAMTRKEKIDELVDIDIEIIDQEIHVGNYDTLERMLRGDDYIPYNKMSDAEVDELYTKQLTYLNGGVS